MMNKVLLIGTLPYPPRRNDTDWGPVLNMHIELTASYANKVGELVEKKTKVSASAWRKLAERLDGFLHAGDLVCAEGKLVNVPDKESGKWNLSVSLTDLEVLAPREVDAAPRAAAAPEGRGTAAQRPAPRAEVAPAIEEFGDDDIPF